MYIYRVPRYMGNVVFESLVWLSTVCTGHGCTVRGWMYTWMYSRAQVCKVFMRHIVDGAIRMNSWHIRSGGGISCLQALYLSITTDHHFIIVSEIIFSSTSDFYHLAHVHRAGLKDRNNRNPTTYL